MEKEELDNLETPKQPRRYFNIGTEKKGYGCLVPALAGIGALFLMMLFLSIVGMAFMVASFSKMPAQISEKIAVVHVEGEIGVLGGVSAEEILRTLRDAEKDSSVRAVVLRIDSPGGAAAASQEIADYISRLKKPVVASVGNSAASGAYWIASACDRIVCNKASSLGSIGVIVTLPNLEELMKKVGVKYIVIYKGKYKDLGNPARELTAEERKLIEEQLSDIYDQFIDFVSRHRKIKRTEVERLATGEVFTGSKAVELGLADKIGNFYDAVEEAKKLANVKGEVEIVDYDRIPYFLKKIEKFFPVSARSNFIRLLIDNLPVAH